MVCYTSTSVCTKQSLIEYPEISQEILSDEGINIRTQIDNQRGESEPIQRLLERQRQVQRQKRECGLRSYLEQLCEDAHETGSAVDVIEAAEKVWDNLKAIYADLAVPDACPGNENNFMYAWNKGEHYLECEIFDTGEVEFFYKQRSTQEIWGEDATLESTFSDDILEKVSIFVHQ